MISEKQFSLRKDAAEYNTELEELVEELQGKLEGSELREEYLTDTVHKLSTHTYEVNLCVNKDRTSFIRLVYFPSYEEAEDFIISHIKKFRGGSKLYNFNNYIYKEFSVRVGTEDKNISWCIEKIQYGGIIPHKDGHLQRSFFSLDGQSI